MEKAEQTRRRRTPTSTATGRSPTSCAVQPVHRRGVPRGAVVSRVRREMICLMEGRHVHPSTIYPGGVGTVATPTLFTDYLTPAAALHGLLQEGRADERRRVRLLLRGAAGLRGGRAAARSCSAAGARSTTPTTSTTTTATWTLGQRDVRDPGSRRGRRAGDDEPRRHQPRHPHPARLSYYEDWAGEETFVAARPARQPGRPPSPVEPDDAAEAAETRPRRRQLLVGDEPALVRPPHRRAPRARHRRRAARAAVGDRARAQGRDAVREGGRRRRRDHAAADAGHAGGAARLADPEWSNALERDRARAYFVAYAAGWRCTS